MSAYIETGLSSPPRLPTSPLSARKDRAATDSSQLPASVSSAFILAKLAIAVVEILFSLYYVDVFLNTYRLTNNWFYIGQAIYVVWNALNDPLFAWIQDTRAGSKVHALTYGGPLLGLSFLLTFFPLGQWIGGDTAVGIHFILTLCCFDGAFTYTALAHCALFAEITRRPAERLAVLRQGELSMLLVAPFVFIAGLLFRREDLARFQYFAVIVAALASGALIFASKFVKTETDRSCGINSTEDEQRALTQRAASPSAASSSSSAANATMDDTSLRTFIMRFLTHRSFLLFITFNFLQILAVAFFNNFLTIILSSLQLGGMIAGYDEYQGAILAASQILPPIFILWLSRASSTPYVVPNPNGKDSKELPPPVPSASSSPSSGSHVSDSSTQDRSYVVIRQMTLVKITLAVIMLLVGRNHTGFFVVYLFLTRALLTTTFSFFNLTLAELIDEDQVKYQRTNPLSSSYFGVNALMTKPAHSITPVIVVSVWSEYGYRENNDATSAPSAAPSDPILSATDPIGLQQVIFLMCVFGPLVTGALQLLLWRFYTLHGDRLLKVKQQLHILTRRDRDPESDSTSMSMELDDGFNTDGELIDPSRMDSSQTKHLLNDMKDKRRMRGNEFTPKNDL